MERPISYNLAVNGSVEHNTSGKFYANQFSNVFVYPGEETDKMGSNLTSLASEYHQISLRTISEDSSASGTGSIKTNESNCSNPSGSSGSNVGFLPSTKEKKPNIFKMIIIIVSFLIYCIPIALSIASFIRVNSLKKELDKEKEHQRHTSNTFCLPCNDLRLGPLEEDNLDLKLLIHTTEKGETICCANGETQNSILMNLLFKRREKLYQAEGCTCNSTNGNSGDTQNTGPRVAAHLVAGLQNRSNGETPYTLKNWIRDGDLAHATGVEVKNSRMIITSSGSYHIYSQILFTNLYKGHANTNISQTLYHYVYRWNIKYPNDGTEMLLKSVRTQCWAENKLYGDYTSHTSGVFKLNAGDNLYVQVSNIDLVSRDRRTTFFGLAKL